MIKRNLKTKSIFVIVSILVLIFVAALTGFAGTGATNSDTNDTPRTIPITGSADVMVMPDEAVFTLLVENMSKNIMEAKSQNDVSIKKIGAIAKDLKIEAKYVKTDYINVSPQYTYSNNGENVFKGYSVSRRLVITLKDLPKFEDLFTKILEAGANYVENVQFMTTDLRKYKDQARALAVNAAKEKAAAMAKELGQTIGKASSIQEIQEDSYSYYSPWSSRSYLGANSLSNVNAASNAVQNTAEQGPQNQYGDDFSPGQIKVSAKVMVVFDLN